jgi:hypothetical protein
MMEREKTEAEVLYADILDRPHHKSPTRPQMSLYDRAAQFSPFAALTGYEAAVEETARLTDTKLVMTEDKKQILDEKLHLLLDAAEHPPLVRITYFIPDGRKEGGAYETVTGRVRSLDPYGGHLVLTDKRTIPLENLWELDWDSYESAFGSQFAE